jgi:hypothetical protein
MNPVRTSITTTAPATPGKARSASACRRWSMDKMMFLPGLGRTSTSSAINPMESAIDSPRAFTTSLREPSTPRICGSK